MTEQQIDYSGDEFNLMKFKPHLKERTEQGIFCIKEIQGFQALVPSLSKVEIDYLDYIREVLEENLEILK